MKRIENKSPYVWLQRFIVLAVTILLMALPALADTTIELDVDSGTNITNEFLYAAKQARWNSGITTIVIPKGKYTVSQLKVWGNTTVKMDGVTLTNVGERSMLRLGNKSSDFDDYNGGKGQKGYSKEFSNIKFIGGTWNGAGKNYSIMQLGHAQNITFENVTFRNVDERHHLEFGACKNVKILGCTFKDYAGSFSNTYNGESIQFEVLTGVGKHHFAGYHDITDETICRDIEIAYCTFSGLKRGIGSHTAIMNSYFSGFSIHDNVFKDITGYAISMMNYENSSVYNNKIQNCGAGILCCTIERSYRNMFKSAKHSNKRSTPKKLNNKIYNNELIITRGANGANFNNANFGIWLYGQKLRKKTGTIPKGDWRVSGVTVSGNTITMNVDATGILLTGSSKNTISGNTVTCNYIKAGGNSNNGGIRVDSGNSEKIIGNTISNK